MLSRITKKCWTCDATTPYEVGWCDACFLTLHESPDLREVYAISQRTADPRLAGLLRKAIADSMYFSAMHAVARTEEFLPV